MVKTADVVIIGAGVMGASIAFNLAKRGVRNVAVLEKKFIAAGATGKSSACVRQHYSTQVGARMAMRSLEIFQNFSEIVGETAGFVRTGYLMGVGERDYLALKKVIAMQQAVGIKTSLLSPKEIGEIAPRVSTHDLAAGAWEPDSGYADPWDTTNAFMRRARELGARLYQNTQVIGLKATAGALTEVTTSNGDFSTSVVVNAAGVWGDRIGAMLGIEIPITVCRHQIRLIKRPATAFSRHPMFYDFPHQFYARPEGRDLTLIGTLDPAEIKDRIDPEAYNDGVDPEQTVDVVAALCERFPSFEAGHLHSGYSGPFDVTPDWHPIIDEAPGVRGFYLAVGFSGHGFKLSPAVGEMIAELVINGKRAESDVNTFRYSRFAENQPVRGMYDEGLMG
ncbi:MAG: NAD(P)/FAD-dependent oxidoreductase [Candidatus Binataceae bacterium]